MDLTKLSSSTGYRFYDSATLSEEELYAGIGVKRRKRRRGEPRPSRRGHITRFGSYGRWISVRHRNGRLQALHATKGWRVIPQAMADMIRQRLIQQMAARG